MFVTLLFQLITFSFIGFNILLLIKLFPVDRTHKHKPKRRKA